jgi:hypothetical protein
MCRTNAVDCTEQKSASCAGVKPAWAAVFVAHQAENPAKSRLFQRNAWKNRKKPVETRLLPLTKPAESRKVNGGRFFRTRVNTGFRAG